MPQKVEIGSIQIINNIAGSVHIEGGTLGGIYQLASGSVGILDQPIGVHGTIDLHSDVTIGTVNIAGTLTMSIVSGTLSNLNNVGTITTVQSGSVGILNVLDFRGTIATVQSGSVGILNTVGISGSIGIYSGTVSLSSSGGSATTPSDAINILSTSTTIFSPNASRSYAVINNYAGTPIYIAFGGEAGTSRGIKVEGLGGIFEINQTNLWRGTVTGITAGASGTSNIGITEWSS